MSDITEKICRKCGQLKPVDAFYENKYSPDGRYAFCKICFEKFAKKLKNGKPPEDLRQTKALVSSIEAPEKEPEPDRVSDQKCEKCGKHRPAKMFELTENTPDFQKNWCTFCRRQHDGLRRKPPETSTFTHKGKKDPRPEKQDPPKTSTFVPPPVSESNRNQAEDFDYIEYLLENESLKRKLSRDILQIPKQITKIKARTRVCNGCGKTEEIDQVEKNTVIPVHAWFCDICRQRSAARWVRRGAIVCDYWGREFKVKKVISPELVLGKLQDKSGKTKAKPQKIYGNWKTGKPRAG